MAESPQPAALTHDGESTPPPPTGTAEDRKAAAALSSLDAHDDETKKEGIDAEALGKAMQNLETQDEKKEADSKKVKIDAADVGLMVEQLDLNKIKATELLKAHDGNVVEAMKAFVTASA